MLIVPGSVVWILPQGQQQDAGVCAGAGEPSSRVSPRLLLQRSVHGQAVPTLDKRQVMAPSSPSRPGEQRGKFSCCSALSSHQSFMAKDVPQPLPEA